MGSSYTHSTTPPGAPSAPAGLIDALAAVPGVVRVTEAGDVAVTFVGPTDEDDETDPVRAIQAVVRAYGLPPAEVDEVTCEDEDGPLLETFVVRVPPSA